MNIEEIREACAVPDEKNVKHHFVDLPADWMRRLLFEYDQVTAERDRYREALERISSREYLGPISLATWAHEALNQPTREETPNGQ